MLKLKRFKEGVWVDYPDANGVRFKIRPVTFTQSMSILSDVKEKRVLENYPMEELDPVTKLPRRGPRIIDDYKEGDFLWKMFDQVLQAWEGIDPVPEGEEAPLGPIEVKRLIFDNNPIREFIFAKGRDLAEAEKSKQEGELKNSVSSQDGLEKDVS